MRILVAYASKHQSTAEIARAIGQTLEQFSNVSANVKEIDQLDYITGYDAVVLGSAVYEGNWRLSAANFLTLHAQELAQIPVWLFSSGPLGEGKTREIAQGWEFPAGLRVIAAQIKPHDIAIFRGKLDIGELNMFELAAAKKMDATPGDYREWEKIIQWAAQIGQALCEEGDRSLKKPNSTT
ncbi:MAG: flavodoxin [Anaerolineaceae bacterium]|nr:flavodoxin [Anaerolineaceae bacterium]